MVGSSSPLNHQAESIMSARRDQSAVIGEISHNG